MPDIKQINGKFYDFAPANESFLITAKELKTLGIKNYYFMLRIDNPRLAYIDPFKPDITSQEISLFMREFRNNMWAYMRMAVRMRTNVGIVQYGLHRGLAAACYNFERHQDFCLCEPRQTWKTTGLIAGPISWAFQLSQNMQTHFFGKETNNTKDNLGHLRDDISLLPEWLQFKRYIDLDEGKEKKSRQSTERLENNLFHNTLRIHPKAASLSHAQNMGRGGSGSLLYFDEIEHTRYIGEIISNSAPLFKTASENAATAGLPYCRCMTCTPGNLDSPEGAESYPIIKSMIPWTEKIYDMTPKEVEDYKSAFYDDYHNGPEKHTRDVMDVFYCEYQYYQVRKNYQWVQEQYALSGDKMAIRREILLQRLRGSTQSPIDPEDIEYLISNMKKANDDLIINGKWRFLLYDHGQGSYMGRLKPFDNRIPYIVGIDPSSGGGGDNFAIVIINPYNLRVAAEFKSPYLTETEALKLFVTLVHDYIPKAVLVPERNSMGVYLVQALIDRTSIGRNVYWSESLRQLEDMVETSEKDYQLKLASAKYKKYGVHTSPKVRKAMFELVFKHINECKEILNTEYLVDDLCKLVRTSTGRIEAAKGEHDDILMAYNIAIYTYYVGDNLPAFGIIKSEHPIIGAIEKNLQEHIKEKQNQFIPFVNNLSERAKTFEEEVIEQAIQMETEAKEMVNTFSFITDDVYSRQNSSLTDPYNGTTSIPASFFDRINGV